jgi:transcriptional regulator with XRE-family HTH domain
MSTDDKSQMTWDIRAPGDLGRAIAGLRHERGLTQEQLAEELEIDRSYLAKMERGGASLALERNLLALRRLGAKVTITLPADDAR